jgi:LysR family glycine cleavage system transcriptional activator
MHETYRWPPLNAFRGFEAAARLNSFSKAAEELGMTQSAISHQIRTLEEFLGQPLFNRVNRGVSLSDAGYDLHQTVVACFGDLANGIKRLDQYKKPTQVVVHTSSAFASTWLLPRLTEFRRTTPDIDVWLYTTDAEQDEEMLEVDLAVLFGTGHWSDFIVEPFFGDAYLPVCSPGYLKAQAPIREPADLLAHTLLHGEDDVPWAAWFEHAGVRNVNPVIGPNFSNPALLLQAAIQGQGIGLGHLVLASGDLNAGRLVSPLDIRVPTRKAHFLVANRNEIHKPKVAAVASWLRAEAALFAERLELGAPSSAAPNE